MFSSDSGRRPRRHVHVRLQPASRGLPRPREIYQHSMSGSSTTEDIWPLIKDWVAKRKKEGTTAADIAESLGLNLLAAHGQDEETRWALTAMAAVQYRSLTQPRERLPGFDAASSAANLLRRSERILVVNGSGVSPGIPGFEAFFEALGEQERCGLPEAEALFDPGRFVHQPAPLLSYARTLMPGTHQPSLSHRFVRELEKRGKLLRVYSQNLDGLERAAGIERVVQCHGTLATASCVACRHRVALDASILDAGADETDGPPRCRECTHTLNVLKPDVGFLGELPASVETEAALRQDLPICDLLVVLGSSLAVDPLRYVPACLARSVPQLLVGPMAPAFAHAWDLQLRGECDAALGYVAKELGWSQVLGGKVVVGGGASSVEKPEVAHDADGGPPIFCFGAAAAAGTANGAHKSKSARKPPQAIPLQTPLASIAQPTYRGQRRWGLSLNGATIAGSGAGARDALAKTAPIVGTAPPPADGDDTRRNGNGKRPAAV
jgi:NAD-dependent SIR2 family protein deacetylase